MGAGWPAYASLTVSRSAESSKHPPGEGTHPARVSEGHMNRQIRNAVLKVILLVALCAAAPALADGGGRDRHRPRRSVPEFDPATGGVIAALLVGGGVLVAKRKNR